MDRLVKSAYQGAAERRRLDRPAAVRRLPVGAARGRGVHLRPRPRPASCSTRRATRRAPTASARCPTASRSAPCGCSPGRRRSARSTIMDFFKEWLDDLGIESEVTAMESNKLTNDDPRRASTTCSTGAGTSSPTRTRSSTSSPATQRGGSSDSWYCNHEYDALYEAAERARSTTPSGSRSIKQMQQIALRGLAVPRARLHDRRPGRTAATGSPASCRSRSPDGVLLIQYGAHNYHLLRPAKEAGDCDGVARRSGPTASSVGGARTTTAAATPC